MKVTFRLSERHDAAALIALNRLVWNNDNAPILNNYESTENYLEKSPPGSELLALCDDVIAGYFSYRSPIPLPANAHVAELAIAVHPDYHGAGIAQALMMEGEVWMRRLGKKKLSLRVMATNARALSFYKKYGFLTQGVLPQEFYINGHYVDDVMMYKML
ncbi:putative acetyltransferase (GNAT) family protein [Fictibacillus macauensis ZFHKF-1]|uniref:Putative acetyltransferase (GNAT) family protein n=1 Tax=Fictibacillus macauensis ZFHKF-1 TaxID=1196324 RepID=I8IXA9_9BACL|nr:GNAT family N-acetyltransferase [Fictibacillus macauensis]EIT84116.1 putative acetyltransferase (GNAT) family protein [Fictibacillus macauensis ZFHKF-1]